MKEQTQRKDPGSAKEKIKKIEAVIRGWINYFWIARAKRKMQELDEMIRMRLIWKQWKRPATRVRNLQRLGIDKQNSYEWGNSRKGYCRVAHSPIMQRSINNEYLTRQGYVGFVNYYFWKTEHQTKLF